MSYDLPPAEKEQIEFLRQEHIGRLLLRAQRAFSLRSFEKLRKLGHEGLTLAQANLIAHLDTTGTRITTLAERANISKQAVGQLVLELEERGYIERMVDEKDRRATLVNFTEAGWKFLQDANQVKREIETEYTDILGEPGFQSLKQLLTRLIESED